MRADDTARRVLSHLSPMTPFTHYIALGDSISIDDYPERETGIAGIGAASLFHRALRERHPDITFANLTADGATTDDVLRLQVPRIDPSDEPTLVTITAGGNDMLMYLRAPRPPVRLVAGITERLTRIVEETAERRPNGRLLLGTVYDPSDGTNELYGEKLEREAEWLAKVNEHIRAIAAAHPNVVLADIHQRFLGHGLTAPPERRWYWSGLIFEPNANGAEAVRDLWVEALSSADVDLRELSRK
jgi:lysophospholipase L1-like esterase